MVAVLIADRLDADLGRFGKRVLPEEPGQLGYEPIVRTGLALLPEPDRLFGAAQQNDNEPRRGALHFRVNGVGSLRCLRYMP